METSKEGKVTYTVTAGSAKGDSRDFTSAKEAAKAFYETDADKKPAVIGVQNIDGREAGSYLAATTTITKGNETWHSKWASGIIDPEFQKAYEDIKRERAQTTADTLHLPTNGRVTIDDYEVTKVNFAKRKDNETTRYDLALTVPALDAVMIKEIKNLDHTDLITAVGEKNAEAINNRKGAKGVLKGKDLEYEYGLSPEENAKRIEEKEIRKAADIEAIGATNKTQLDEEQEINASVPLGSIPGAMARLNQRNGMVEVIVDDKVTAFGGKPAIEKWAKENDIAEADTKTLLSLEEQGSNRYSKDHDSNIEPAAGLATAHLIDNDVRDRLAAMWPEKVIGTTQEAQADTTADKGNMATETNTIELDTDITQAKAFEAEVKENVARLQANRETLEQRQQGNAEREDQIENTDIGANLGARQTHPAAMPEDVAKSYIRIGENKYHYNYKPELQAFEDKGNKLETNSSGEHVVHDLVSIAEARGWENIKVRGTEEFKRHVWLEASLRGIDCHGYKPTSVDLAVLESRRKELPANVIEKDRVHTHTQKTEAEKQKEQQEKKEQTATQQHKAEAAAIATGAALAGVLLEHGKANYNFDKDEKPNYYVKYRNDKGEEKTVWGVDLERAIRESKTELGQRIELENKGRKAVTVQAPVKDVEGKVIAFQPKETHRNAWEVKAESLRTEGPKEAIKKHPDLAPAFAVIKAAEIVAKDKFRTEPDQQKFVGMVRNTLAERIATAQKIPEVKISVHETAKEQAQQQERDIAH